MISAAIAAAVSISFSTFGSLTAGGGALGGLWTGGFGTGAGSDAGRSATWPNLSEVGWVHGTGATTGRETVACESTGFGDGASLPRQKNATTAIPPTIHQPARTIPSPAQR